MDKIAATFHMLLYTQVMPASWNYDGCLILPLQHHYKFCAKNKKNKKKPNGEVDYKRGLLSLNPDLHALTLELGLTFSIGIKDYKKNYNLKHSKELD